MSRKMPIMLALLALGGAIASRAEGGKSGVKDRAGLFSPGAVSKADRALADVARESGWRVVVETVESLEGRPIRERTIEDAKASGVHGLFILISKGDHKTQVEPSRSAEKAFPKAEVSKVVELLDGSFRKKEFDAGLLAAIDEIRDASTRTPSPEIEAGIPAGGVGGRTEPAGDVSAEKPAADRPAEAKRTQPGPLKLAAMAIGLLAAVWLLGRLFRRSPQGSNAGPTAGHGAPYPQPGQGPGMPGGPPMGGGVGQRPGYGNPAATGPVPQGGPAPGYGPANYPAGPGYPAPAPAQGGGGFMSGAIGGLGGAVLGNVLYDKFGRPHADPGQAVPHGGADVSSPGSIDPVTGAPVYHPADPSAPAPPAEQYDPDAGAGGDWGSPAPDQPSADAAPQDWGGGDGGGEGDGGGDWSGPDQGQAPDGGGGGEWSGGDDSGQGGDWGGGDDGGQDNQGDW